MWVTALRKIDTLRVSVTDRCNLRCVYCMPKEGLPLLAHDEVLTFEELTRIVRIAVTLGVRKVRLTGGEPLVRKDFPDLVAMLSGIEGITDIPLTTNGVLLFEYAEALKKAGLSRVTISLDTLKSQRFKEITSSESLHMVLHGFDKAQKVSLKPVKINTVIVPGQNDDEILDFAELAHKKGLEVRFIERMPIPVTTIDKDCAMPSLENLNQDYEHIASDKIKQIIESKWGKLSPIQRNSPADTAAGPAVRYMLGDGPGRIGFISPISEPFCTGCGRMRLTADGKLRPCLVAEKEIDIKGPLRNGASDEQLKQIFTQAIKAKPIQNSAPFKEMNRNMSQIGG